MMQWLLDILDLCVVWHFQQAHTALGNEIRHLVAIKFPYRYDVLPPCHSKDITDGLGFSRIIQLSNGMDE